MANITPLNSNVCTFHICMCCCKFFFFLNGSILNMQMRVVINRASVGGLAVGCDVIYYALHIEHYEFINNITHRN